MCVILPGKDSQMRKFYKSTLAAIILYILAVAFNPANALPYGTTKSAVITVPEGQVIRTIVTTPLTSDHLSLGQNVTMVLGEDFYFDNKLVAPIDSVVSGSVIKVSRSTPSEGGKLLLRFTRITTPYGIQVPISAIVKNDNKTGMLTGAALADEGKKDVDIPVTTPIDLVLIQPITVNPEIYNTNY